ncbi:alpha-1,4-digalacturonate transport system substrate-binding protein [Rhizobium laguerreae]|uniref:sn-glycerol-3-phosphate-binding periplasmic protein UgpB n=1 Tax=Rhizobium laguerreae TaxID=1076926 RepID=A0ABR6GAX7_9HYPH|nr:ABC transporter substrate-binding protein [Rhizobium laguerreae]MBB3163425.1 alpha-1,4-digalacturonate transport system substrate-binding protein [Rhizobium laguerreae]OOO41725.1 ABC transporter substrate-binding protein [Rhizobium laguerreae]
MTRMKSIGAAFAAILLSSVAAHAGDVRIMWYSDGGEGEVIKDLLSRFSKANPDVNVILDEVSYDVVKEQLPVQLEAGQGPDIARLTNLKAPAQHWLDLRPYLTDAKYWEDNFGAQADWMRPDGSTAITGFMTQLTLTGGFVNKTLFEQAGVEIPGPKATWDDWAAAAKKVADSQKVFAMAIDRSGHRVSGPNISYGANYIAADGKPAPIDQGAKDFLSRFVKWNEDGTMNKDVWVSAAGTTYRSAAEDFINGGLAYLYSGSWQVSGFAQKIGDNFDWVMAGSPCGTAACSGMQGGAGLVAVKYTKNPKDVAKVMDYLAGADVQKEFAERSLFIPAHKGVAAGQMDFKTDNPHVQAALKAFVEAAGQTAAPAIKLPGWKWSDAYYSAIVARISQVIAGEMKLDDAYARIDEDIKAKVAGN